MKILFLTKELPFPVNNGHRMRSFHYIKGLLKGNELKILCFKDNLEIDERVAHFKGMGCCVDYLECDDKKGNKYLEALISLFSGLPFSIKSRYSRKMEQKLENEVHEWKPEILICDGIHMALHIDKNFSCYKILDEHNVESTIIERFLNVEKNIFKKLFAYFELSKFIKFENEIWPKFDEIHVCSSVDKDQVERRSGHKKVNIVPNGVDISEFKNNNVEARKSRLVFTGLIGWKPNEDAMLYFLKDVYCKIKERVSEVELFIVGKNPTRRILKAAEKDSSITVTGFVDDVKPYIAESNVFIVPLRIGSGTRLKILEAMAMKKAIVSTSIGCEGLDITNNENILIADDPGDFTDKTVKLINDHSLNERIASSGHKLVEEKYSWDSISEKLNSIIKGIK